MKSFYLEVGTQCFSRLKFHNFFANLFCCFRKVFGAYKYAQERLSSRREILSVITKFSLDVNYSRKKVFQLGEWNENGAKLIVGSAGGAMVMKVTTSSCRGRMTCLP